MELVLALLQAAAALAPEIEAALPAVQALIAGQKVTSAQMVTLWSAVAALEEQAAAKAAALEAAQPQPVPQAPIANG